MHSRGDHGEAYPRQLHLQQAPSQAGNYTDHKRPPKKVSQSCTLKVDGEISLQPREANVCTSTGDGEAEPAGQLP